MRVLITGAEGYLGRCITEKFKNTICEIFEVVHSQSINKFTCNLLIRKEVVDLNASINPDLIIHCAAFVPKTQDEYNSETLSKNNIQILSNLIKATDCPIIFISSMTVYGPSQKIVRYEDDAGESQSEYGASKLLCEKLLKQSRRDSLSIRLPGLFGGSRNSGLIANTIKFLSKKEKPDLPKAAVLWAAMSVHDAAESIIKLSYKDYTGFNVVNLAYDEVYSINKFISICEEIFSVSIEYDVLHPDFSFDLSRVKKYGAMPKVNFREALFKYKRMQCE